MFLKVPWENGMRVSFDPEVDALYVRLDEARIKDSAEVLPGIIVDFNDEDQVVGIEVLRASKTLTPEVFRQAIAAAER